MFNKIYEYLKKYIKENWLFLIIVAFVIAFNFYDTGYSIYKPGGTINSSDRVSGTNLNKSKGSFNMAYVGMLEGNLPFYLLAKVMPEWELVKNDDLTASSKEDINDTYTRDHLYYEEAISNATYVAFTKAKVSFKITDSKYYIIYLTDENKSKLKIGENITGYDNYKFTTLEKFIKYIQTKNVGDTINVKYEDGGEAKVTTSTVYEEKGQKYLGISVVTINKYESNYNIKIAEKTSESGPSGGFITALSIYNALTKEDLTGGKKIVGTGTIDIDGTVGEIGSVTYKLASAVKDHADIFLCPTKNYQEAIKYAKKHNYDIIIKDIATFDEAISYLERINNNE